MQRYFSFASAIELQAIDKHTIAVFHPALIDAQIANEIKVAYLMLGSHHGDVPSPSRPESIKFDPATPGQAILHFPHPWQRETGATNYPRSYPQGTHMPDNTPANVDLPDNELLRIYIKVSMPDYSGSESGTITSKRQTLNVQGM